MRASLVSMGFRLAPAPDQHRLPFPLWRPSSFPPRTDSYLTSLVREYWRRGTHRGSELRSGLETGDGLERWPVASQRADLFEWEEIAGYAQDGQHINCLEMRSVLTALKCRMNASTEQRCVFLHLVDSMVCLSALAKGRSSSRELNNILRRVASVKLAMNYYPLFGYVRSEDNPADAPSRKCIKKILKPKPPRRRHASGKGGRKCQDGKN